MNQLAIPTEVTILEIVRKRTLGEAIALSLDVAGLEPKQIVIDGKCVDKGQWSRWISGDEGIKWPKLRATMDQCGNHAPLLWMVHAMGYDLNSMHRRESELERQLRESREEVAALRRVLMVRGVEA